MPLRVVPSVKFEILIPATYVNDPGDPAAIPQYVQFEEVISYIETMTEKYGKFGGYTVSNPLAPPPFAGGFRGTPQERNFSLILLIPDHLINDALTDIRQFILFFQRKYNQLELLASYYSINRLMPTED